MKLSIVDLSPVPDNGTAAEAYANTVAAARQAEQLGYSRFWVAEHHGMADTIAGTTPEVLLGRLAGETDSIRLGSGAVLLNHYSPFKVAEAFGALDALAPGRIDAGLGRANGSPAADRALGTERHVQNPDEDHTEKIEAVVTHLYDDYPDGHAYSDLEIPHSSHDVPTPWVLGSSPSSAAIAGELGLRYCFAAFIRPQFATHAFDEYRERFQPSQLAGGIDEPQGMVAVNAVCAETDEEAARLRAVAEASYKRMQRGIIGTTPSIEEAIDELGGVPEPTPATLDSDEWPRAISGSPETLASLLEQLTERVGVDEVMIQHIVSDHEHALRSHELLADGVGLTPR
ncbi:LLM class flavin-dependent oxidoreductase (plasmid) [Haloferax mediterranei ATCC 33500]|uniref:Alkanal monooxygenase (FMN-linked) n=1 Tax=Haloferax mediterranei (strain ATCC 33500 / DSM 1411 / JCM 8866 / NBRC 14739 / NCIMB 2177 / R-4) TaxID=523841 RepID=I3RAP0_HALMT|nr:LLM class flavin-dependent oxidoreductase [Haloferax mediterranei]AFK21300.1 alkanal monooxygenase (FMN-linked) [Haloferax mediterranei ATCC 33500]AHZ24604.1 alkane 1-monooxygenase [Haloferax mediterranei ATCC 33500]ELZ97368.1 alkanal monooxygenase (FMN-linked) [Haloferax mediterranei ATCC 33500]MDX5990337.1 LLM class flavin-dependent oxidoreductase [Haloferax mediterranei ATCC 33500]QCQ77001.1 LLM class flavin-dependent oxidoreductase [Haloferax mediterranei ATCC 33500]